MFELGSMLVTRLCKCVLLFGCVIVRAFVVFFDLLATWMWVSWACFFLYLLFLLLLLVPVTCIWVFFVVFRFFYNFLLNVIIHLVVFLPCENTSRGQVQLRHLSQIYSCQQIWNLWRWWTRWFKVHWCWCRTWKSSRLRQTPKVPNS